MLEEEFCGIRPSEGYHRSGPRPGGAGIFSTDSIHIGGPITKSLKRTSALEFKVIDSGALRKLFLLAERILPFDSAKLFSNYYAIPTIHGGLRGFLPVHPPLLSGSDLVKLHSFENGWQGRIAGKTPA
ncbi:hypothetical protein LEP1GSC050_4092 [Leptospira broomii serovar Hurstbridge str. 5399]|uniref:Uncharacterized protein n=1 Tax=Leptospira broomii serovar Hurstbridge str. 5399 TaxID=1049789 RepID=T0FBP9_9LEPT|nr:hypothetical protein LEP1GSC050_4092 [Leptospira broomii serovar Hurstbridge str. 5399]